MNQYAYRINNQEYFEGRFNTEEEALEEAKFEYGELIKYDGADKYEYTIEVGLIKEFETCVDADSVIERLAREAYDEVGEYAEDYLYRVPNEALKALEVALTEVFIKWSKKYKQEPDFWTVRDFKTYKFEVGELKCQHTN